MKEMFFAVLFLTVCSQSFSRPIIHDGGVGGTAGQGGFFSPAAVLKRSTFSVGFEPQIYFDASSEYGFLGHLRYGVAPRFELNSNIGIYNEYLYMSFGLSYQAFYEREKMPGLTFRANYFFNDDGFFSCEGGCGIDADAILGHRFGSASWYGGLNLIYRESKREYYDMSYNQVLASKTEYEYNLIGGVHYLMYYWAGLNAEIGLNVNNKKTSYASAGMTFYFGK